MPEFDSTVEYRPITDFPAYCVGNDGSVWSRWQRVGSYHCGSHHVLGDKWVRLKAGSKKSGHCCVLLHPGAVECLVHRLVLEAFVGPCPDGMEACHDPDPNPANNASTNLRWDTHKNNIADAMRQGRMNCGEQRHCAKLTAEAVREIRQKRAAGVKARVLGKQYGVDRNTILSIVTRRTWKHIA